MKSYKLTMKGGVTHEFNNYHEYAKAHDAYSAVDSRREKGRVLSDEIREENIPLELLAAETQAVVEAEEDKEEK